MAGSGAAKGGGGGGTAEGEYTTAKTSVWWDIENCAVPRGSDPHHIAQNIRSALASLGYKGSVFIFSFGNTNQIPEPVQQALHSTGIFLNHVPAGVKDASDKKILVDMLFWANDNPPPANYLLVSGDRDFSYALHQLRMRGYNVLLARQPNVSQALEAAAMSVWHWKDLVIGLPPLSESPCTSNVVKDCIPSSELFNKSLSDAASAQPSEFHASGCKTNQKSSGNWGDGSRNKWKQGRKLPNQNQVISFVPSTSADQFKQPSNGRRSVGTNNNLPHMEQQKQMPMTSGSVSQDVASMKHKRTYFTPQLSPQKPQSVCNSNRSDAKDLREVPRESCKTKTYTPSEPLSGQIQPFFMKSNKSSTHDKVPDYPQLLKPSDLLSSHSSNVLGSVSSSNKNSSSYTPPITPHDLPVISTQTLSHGSPFSPGRCPISDSPSSSHHHPSYFPQTPNPMNSFPVNPKGQPTEQIMCHDYMQRPPAPTLGAPECLPLHNEAEHLIRNILFALNMLKDDKMAPTEANIADCIHYGEINFPNFNVKVALDCAIFHQVVVMHKLGGNLPFYVGKHDKLWKCVNVMDSIAEHPSATWDVVYSFLRSPAGRSSIMASRCRYHAATILRKGCLNHLVMGEVLQILHMIINIKKWIIPQFEGWQPLSFNLETLDKHAGKGASTGKSFINSDRR